MEKVSKKRGTSHRVVGGVFGVKPSCSEHLHPKERYSDYSDKARAMAEMLLFLEERLREAKVLIAVSHEPEVASLPCFLPRGFSFLDEKCLNERSDYGSGEGIIIDFSAKTVRLFPLFP
jgi:hypothetical protein